MGNNLCATWQKGYRDGCEWPLRKDAHLIRLWAEIFEVREENNEVLWGRVSDDVVPVNVVCVQDSPETIYQITAYNRLVEKIFDVYLMQPGTRIIQASDCFVHWRDAKCDREWGLNFTVPLDARRFRECCMSHVCQGLARKALSSESVRVSQSKQKGPNMKTGSNQTSPMSLSQAARLVTTAQDNNEGKCMLIHSQELQHQHQQQQQQQQQHYATAGLHPLSATTQHNSQQVQVRQVLSVYVDNRCRCGTEYHPLVQLPDCMDAASQHRPQSFPVGTNLYATRQELQATADVYSNVHLEQDTQCCRCHCLVTQAAQQNHASSTYGTLRNYPCHYGRNCHLVDDNAINQSIYMSAKEARAAQKKLLLPAERSNQAVALAGTSSHYADVREIAAAKQEIIEAEARTKDSLLSQKEDLTGQQQSQVLLIPARPRSSVTPTGQVLGNNSELPASFDSVTLKRMLRSLSGSPPIDRIKLKSSKGIFKQDKQSNQNSVQTSSSSLSLSPSKLGTTSNLAAKNDLEKSSEGNVAMARLSLESATEQEKLAVNDGHNVETTVQQETLTLGATEKIISSCSSERKDNAVKNNISCIGQLDNGQISSVVLSDSSNHDTTDKENCLEADNKDAMANSETAGAAGIASVGQHHRTDSGSWAETPEVRRLTMSDLSGSDCGSDGEGANDTSSIYTVSQQTAFVSRSMAIRKAGWLMVKNWLVHRKRSIELASKRTWNKYWVFLKGNVLLFYVCDEGQEVTDEQTPKYKLVLEGALAQAVPEHPKKQNVFSLSTAFGDAYLLQATSSTDLNDWMNAVHCACSAAFCRQYGRESALRLLHNETHRIETSIDLDLKMKKMATMHLTAVNDAQSHQAIDKQIMQWEENLEKLYTEHYRLRSYAASMKCTEPPNPKVRFIRFINTAGLCLLIPVHVTANGDFG